MRLLFFAQLRNLTGRQEISWDTQGPITAQELWRQLESTYPSLGIHRTSTRLSRNGEYANRETLFFNEDEVALIPPVSGG